MDVPNDSSGEPEPSSEERRLELPSWVPAAIGLTLVALAFMAVYTGFRSRVRPEARVEVVTPFSEEDGLYPEESGGPPGSPEAGGSRVRPGGDVPAPGPLEEGEVTDLAIKGGPEGVTGVVKLSVSRGLVFDVAPSDAVIFVNGLAVGTARQFGAADEAYEFAEEGLFTVRITAPGYDEVEIEVRATQDADEEIADVSLRLQPIRDEGS